MSSSQETDATPVQLYIALYKLVRGPGAFHWALALSNTSPGIQPVNIYQIVDEKKIWELSHRSAILRNSESFVGCIRIPMAVNMTLEQLHNFLLIYEPYPQNSDPEFITPMPLWSCSMWVLRALNDLKEAGVVTIEMDMSQLRQRILALGMRIDLEGRGATKDLMSLT